MELYQEQLTGEQLDLMNVPMQKLLTKLHYNKLKNRHSIKQDSYQLKTINFEMFMYDKLLALAAFLLILSPVNALVINEVINMGKQYS